MRGFFHQLTGSLFFIPCGVIIAAEPTAKLPSEVHSALEQNCFRCHGPEKQKGRVRLDTLSPDFLSDSAAVETWHDALNAIQLGEMPPEDEPELTDENRKALTGWIQGELDRVIAMKKSSDGRVVIRRLNRVEYQHTMQDLLGLKLDFVKNLPPDGLSPDGFQNNGASLGMSGMQLEQYLGIARNALKRAIVTGPEPEVFEATTTKSTTTKGTQNYSNLLSRTGVFIGKVPEVPNEGEYELRIRAKAILPTQGAPFPRMKVDFGFRADTQFPSREMGQIDVTSTETKDYVFRGRIEEFPIQSRTQSKYPGQLIVIRNVFDDGKPSMEKQSKTEEAPVTKKKKKPKKKKVTFWVPDPNYSSIQIESVSFKSPIFTRWPPSHHQQLLNLSESSEKGELIVAQENLKTFLSRAYRRPPSKGEINHLLSFYTKIRPKFETFEETIREVFAMALISPEFLYLVELGTEKEKRPLDQFELASRLSYFLWSSMPDEELFDLAKRGKLSSPSVLTQEVERMLSDSKSRRFVEQFTSQWLDLPQVDRVAINPQFYPEFKNDLKPWMQEEACAFFAEILDNELSAMLFIDSDFAMLNEPLAKHYGFENGPRSRDFERVTLAPESRRGGLLAQASMLLGGSNGEDSHPIKRAVWIRERLLHDPPAPPPPNVPSLDPENPNFANLTVREQLAAHREDAACADCHRGIDPWGIALEEFDAVGLYRESITLPGKRKKTRPVMARETLPGGHEVDGLTELKRYLLSDKKDQFAHALVLKLLSYSLGRSLELTDEPELEALSKSFADNGYRLKDLIKEIVLSPAFSTK